MSKRRFFDKLISAGEVGIYSFYKSNVASLVIEKQRAVFDRFDLPITQVLNNDISHGEFLNSVLRSNKSPEYIVFFDIDCIPLNRKCLWEIVNQIKGGNTIAGAAQTANHLMQGKNLYIGPFFFAITRKVYSQLGYPDMNDGLIWDVGGLLTMAAKMQGSTKLIYWYPTSVDTPKWKLYNKGMFGLGTIYNRSVYHAFESRLGESDNLFIRKCDLILNKD